MHPELLTKALIARVQERGGQLRLARLLGLETEGGRVTGVRIQDQGASPVEETTLKADAVVLAMGKRVQPSEVSVTQEGRRKCAGWNGVGMWPLQCSALLQPCEWSQAFLPPGFGLP